MRLSLLLLPLFFVSSYATVTSTITTTQYLTLTSTVAPSVPSASSSYSSDTDFVSSVLNSTNFYRTQHYASALTWNDTLATYAAKYANNCVWKHSVSLTIYVTSPSSLEQDVLTGSVPAGRSKRRKPSRRLRKHNQRRRCLGQ